MNFSISSNNIDGHILLCTDKPLGNNRRYGIICKVVSCIADPYTDAIYSRPEDFAEYKDVIKTLFKLAHNRSIIKTNLNF